MGSSACWVYLEKIQRKQKACETEGAAENVIKSIGEMVVKIAITMKSNTSPLTLEKAVGSAVGISPVRKMYKQDKLLLQLQHIHSMLE